MITPTDTLDYSDTTLVEFLDDVMAIGAEGGINYWALVHAYEWTGAPRTRHLIISDTDDGRTDQGEHLTITLAHIAAAVAAIAGSCTTEPRDAWRGMHIQYRREIRNAWEAREAVDLDASHGDMIIQFIALDNVVYG